MNKQYPMQTMCSPDAFKAIMYGVLIVYYVIILTITKDLYSHSEDYDIFDEEEDYDIFDEEEARYPDKSSIMIKPFIKQAIIITVIWAIIFLIGNNL